MATRCRPEPRATKGDCKGTTQATHVMRAGELLKAAQDGELQEFLRHFCSGGGTGTDTNTNTNTNTPVVPHALMKGALFADARNLRRRACNAAYYAKDQPRDALTHSWGIGNTGSQITAIGEPMNIESPFDRRRLTGRGQPNNMLPWLMSRTDDGPEIPQDQASTPIAGVVKNTWAMHISGTNFLTVHVVSKHGTLSTEANTRGTLNLNVPHAHLKVWLKTLNVEGPGCTLRVNGHKGIIYVLPGVVLLNIDMTAMTQVLCEWGLQLATPFAQALRHARHLATRDAREGVANAFGAAQFGELREGRGVVRTVRMECPHCVLFECDCKPFDTSLETRRVARATRHLTDRQVSVMKAEEELEVARQWTRDTVREAVLEAQKEGFITSYRFTVDSVHMFMGPFVLELESITWQNTTFPAGTYTMPVVWMVVPWESPTDVSLLCLDGQPHTHGHVQYGGAAGRPCIGHSPTIGTELKHMWFKEPIQYIKWWWNYCQTHNVDEFDTVGPIQGACVLTKLKEL